LRSYPTRRVIG